MAASVSYTTELIDHADIQPPTYETIHRMRLPLHTVGTAIVTTDILFIASIPEGKRLAGGSLSIGAGGAAVTGEIGDYTYEKVMEGEPAEWTGEYAWTVGTADKFGTLTDLTLASTQTFGDTAAKGLGTEGVRTNGKTQRIGIKFTDDGGGEAVQVGTTITGWIDVV